jgi:hypothetical protein
VVLNVKNMMLPGVHWNPSGSKGLNYKRERSRQGEQIA